MNLFNDNRLLKVADNVWQVTAPKNGQFPYSHGFLFTGNKNILIDAGADEDFIISIDREIGIDTLLISHSHPDHIRRWFVLSHREIIAPKEMPDSVYNLELLGERYVGTRERGLYWVEAIGKTLGIRPLREPDSRFSDGNIIDIGSARIETVHTPGHLDDHYCFFEHISGTLISTDIDFTSFGPWYGNPEGRIKPFIASVKKIMSFPYKRICTSHKPPYEGDSTPRFEAYLAAFERQKNEILRFIGSGKTLHEIAAGSPFYNNRFMDLKIQYAFEEHMAAENISILMEEGRVTERDGVYIPA